ncbi:MAG: peptide ABC transporter substrate-binding protein, partial [Opitutaceae bacterium]|nr:peptide ABC transporter substrate-binding protein [Opitutaceae bacterium]
AALGCEAPDDRTLRLTLEHPTPYLPALTANPIWFPLNSRVLTAAGAVTDRSNPWARAATFTGNGPFALAEWRPDAFLRATRNPHYWDAAQVQLNAIVFYPTENPDTEERNFRAGQVHLTYAVPATKLATYRAENPAALRLDPFLQTIFLRFNTTRPPFDQPAVRRAFALAIDRPAITRSVLRGANPPAPHFTPSDLGGYTARARIGTDYAAARELLASAGYPGGRGFPTVTIQVRNDAQQPGMAEVLQALWRRELGVRLEIRTMEQKTWVQNQQALDYQISGAGWIGDFADPVTFLDLFVSDGGNNWTGWKNTSYDELIAQATATPDPAARFELFQQAEALLLQEAPVTPVFFGTHSYLTHASVHGWEPALLGFHQYKKISLQP